MYEGRYNLIPEGSYCMDNEGLCPHYETKEVKGGLILKAFCHFTGKEDEKLCSKEKDMWK